MKIEVENDNKFSEIGKHMFSIIDTAKQLRDDLNIIFLFHPDIQIDENGQSTKKIKTIGKLLDEKYTPEASFSTLLYTEVTFEKDGSPKYSFITNRTQTCPAKSAEGMFESTRIENDLQKVITTMREYYS